MRGGVWDCLASTPPSHHVSRGLWDVVGAGAGPARPPAHRCSPSPGAGTAAVQGWRGAGSFFPSLLRNSVLGLGRFKGHVATPRTRVKAPGRVPSRKGREQRAQAEAASAVTWGKGQAAACSARPFLEPGRNFSETLSRLEKANCLRLKLYAGL